MAFTHAVRLTLGSGDTAVTNWDGYAITLDMMQPGSPWTFSFWKSTLARTAWDALRQKCRLGTLVLLHIDDALQLSGRVERYKPKVTRAGATLIISGRDMAGPALSWDADPGIDLTGANLSDLLTRLFASLDLAVSEDDADTLRLVNSGQYKGAHAVPSRAVTTKVTLAHPKPGDTVWGLASHHCARLGYLLWTGCNPLAPHDGALSLIVGKPAFDTPVRYRFGLGDGTLQNVLDIEDDAQIADVPTTIHGYTDAPLDADTPGRIETVVVNDRLDPDLVVHPLPPQPRYLHSKRARTPDGIKAEAQRVLAQAMARHRVVTVTVQGHGQVVEGAMRLYTLNTMARVDAPDCGVTGLHDDMLITAVTFRGSRSDGQTTTLRLVPKGSIVVEPQGS